jgi:hypothetical protein
LKEHHAALLVGLITATAAVLASLVTGIYAGRSTRDVIHEQGRTTAARLDADARGAARILSMELFVASKEMADLAGDGYFRPFDAGYDLAVSEANLRLIASRLARTTGSRLS